MIPPSQKEIERVYRESAPRALASLISRIGDFDLAEECLQDALLTALERWPEDGIPPNPGGWLVVTARRRALDRLRRHSVWQEKKAQLESQEMMEALERKSDDPMDIEIPDERLRLIFTCCHPALSLDSQVALTLRTVAGLTTSQISRIFLLAESTLAQRIVRAKNKIRDARIPYAVPTQNELPERLDGVLGVIYLVFNQGYSSELSSTGDDQNSTDQAIRLGRTLVELMPCEPEALGLLALMVFHQARAPGRAAADAHFISLGDQDRSKWDRDLIFEGLRLLQRASSEDRPGPYQIQAAISAAHCLSRTPAETNWAAIVELYDALARIQRSPVVELNRVVALSMASGPEVAFEALEDLEFAASLGTYLPYHKTRAELLVRLDRSPEAADAYRRALELASSTAEQNQLRGRLEEITRH